MASGLVAISNFPKLYPDSHGEEAFMAEEEDFNSIRFVKLSVLRHWVRGILRDVGVSHEDLNSQKTPLDNRQA